MLGTVPIASMLGMVFSFIISLGLPVFLVIYWRKKTKASIPVFFIGAGIFFVAVIVLESIFHSIVLKITKDAITGNPFVYALYGGLAAGIFEECGRLIAMKRFMKKTLDKKNSIMYGIGHGGCEAILLVAFSSVTNLFTSLMINSGTMEMSLDLLPEETKAATITQLSTLCSIPSGSFFASGIERISAVAIHICLSFLVYYSVKEKKKEWFFIAIAIHAAFDFVAALMSRLGANMWILEATMAAMVTVIAYFTYGMYKKCNDQETEDSVIAQ